jgi:hypothetical protein
VNREEIRSSIYSFFSDTLMVFLALLIIPIVVGEYLFELTTTQNLVFSALAWVIYSLFFAEFILKFLVAKNKRDFIKTNKLFTAMSLIIILSPILEPISELFATAPALRALRIVSAIRLSRLTRLAATSGRAKISWRRINFKIYAITAMIIGLAFSASFFAPRTPLLQSDQNLLSMFIGVVGTIYAIITGFMIANVWNKYMALINATTKETTSLRNIYLLGLEWRAPGLIEALRMNLSSYASTAIDVYWKQTKQMDYLESKFNNLFGSIKDFDLSNPKDIEIFTNLNDELRKASEQKANIQSLLAAKVPKILWSLLIVLSFAIVSGMYIVPFENQFLSTLAMTLISIAIALIGLIIYDMNDPFGFGFWAVTPEAYIGYLDFIND